MVEGRWQLGTVLSCLPWPDLWSVRSRLASKTQLSSWIQWLRAVACCPGRLLHTLGLLRASRPLKEGEEGGGDGGDCFLLHPPATLRSRKSLDCTARSLNF